MAVVSDSSEEFTILLSAQTRAAKLKIEVTMITGGLLNTTSGTYGGGESIEPTDGKELSIPAVKRKCVHSEHSIVLCQVLGV